VVSRSWPLASSSRLPVASIESVAEVYRPGSKRGSSGRWEVVLLDARGAERVIAQARGQADAVAIRTRVRAFLDDRNLRNVEVETPPDRIGFTTAVAALLVGLALIVNAFWAAGRLRVEVDRANDVVRFRRTLFGVPIGREALHSYRDITDVKLERGPVKDALRMTGQAAESGGRLVLVANERSEVPLTERFMRGEDALVRGFGALRAALQLPVIEPPPLRTSAAGTVTTSPRATGPRAWRPVALVVGVLFLIAVGGNALLAWHADGTQGAIEIHAEHRCTFQGMELLPGGELRMSLDPGPYVVGVWSPSAPGGWEMQTYEVRIGETTTITCRPTATSRGDAR